MHMHFFELWLPTLLSAVFVFVTSSLIHMMLTWHKSDYGALPNEDQFRNAVRGLAILPGDYVIPRAASSQDMRSPEFKAKTSEGPNVIMTVMPAGPMMMGKTLVQWFLYCLVVSFFAGHVAMAALGYAADQYAIYHTVGVFALASYTFALWQFSIWYKRSWVTTIKATIDGLVYAVITAATFGWLWPR